MKLTDFVFEILLFLKVVTSLSPNLTCFGAWSYLFLVCDYKTRISCFKICITVNSFVKQGFKWNTSFAVRLKAIILKISMVFKIFTFRYSAIFFEVLPFVLLL